MKKVIYLALMMSGVAMQASADIVIDGHVRSIYISNGDVHVRCRGRGECIIVTSPDNGTNTIRATVNVETGKQIYFAESFTVRKNGKGTAHETEVILHKVCPASK